MKRITIQPTTLFVLTLSLLILFSIFAVIEFNQSRHDILSLMEDEGLVLLNALMAGAERSILAYEKLELQMQARLFQAAIAVDILDAQHSLNRSDLNEISGGMDVYRIFLFDRAGKQVLNNAPSRIDGDRVSPNKPESALITDIISGKSDSLLIGFRQGGLNQQRYAVAIARRKGGAILVTADAENLLELRREVGPGRFLQEIGDRTGVVYVTLQDTLGIRMASRDLKRISSIQHDSFLNRLLIEQTESSRIAVYQDQTIFEIASVFIVNDEVLGLFRIGLNANTYVDLMRTSKIRMFFVAVSLLLVGVIGFSLFVSHQNAQLWSRSYREIQTHTGEILEHLEDAVIAVDGGGIITVCNASAESLFELSRDDVIGKSLQSVNRCCFQYLLRAMHSGKDVCHQESVCRYNDHVKTVLINASSVRNDRGIISAGIMVATDLTMQRRLESELRRQEHLKAMGTLASGVAHEVRNPINAIGMIAQRFRKEFEPKSHADEYRKLTSVMVQEVHRINAIIQQFLQFARPSKMNPGATGIRQLLQSTATFFESSAGQANIEFITELGSEATLQIDADQMRQALLNLLKNAIEACQAGDRLVLSSAIETPDYVIRVQDTGKGISESDQKRIFDLYFTTKAEGTGLGLPIVSQIVQAHGGTMQIESREGEGTTVTIRLPLNERME